MKQQAARGQVVFTTDEEVSLPILRSEISDLRMELQDAYKEIEKLKRVTSYWIGSINKTDRIEEKLDKLEELVLKEINDRKVENVMIKGEMRSKFQETKELRGRVKEIEKDRETIEKLQMCMLQEYEEIDKGFEVIEEELKWVDTVLHYGPMGFEYTKAEQRFYENAQEQKDGVQVQNKEWRDLRRGREGNADPCDEQKAKGGMGRGKRRDGRISHGDGSQNRNGRRHRKAKSENAKGY